MLKIKHIFLLLILFFFVACGDKRSQSNSLIYVSRVLDGDTFEANGQRYRIAEIDAPEISQQFGNESKSHLQSLILHKRVSIKTESIDRYNRKIVKVYAEENYIAESIVKNGFAWFYERYSNNSKLRNLEKSARQNKKGLWKYNSVNPYQYRKLNK